VVYYAGKEGPNFSWKQFAFAVLEDQKQPQEELAA